MNCSTCENPVDNAGLICADCGKKTHENCGSLVASPNLDDMGSEIMFYCFSCKNPAQNFPSNPNSLESSSQVSIKTPRADYASRYSATLNQIESDSKSLPKFDLKARKSIMEEFFEGGG
ncbi:hypothetical protein DSO57_1037172 [Entomophthora muscae]|uniref:Uncharacterized protein n=1 Tax=Entomophthora muscae TaxID=34485 RepID=A0ACC2UJU8_9FUNG|nr:hypothetical protein DSO57_1037172 [Entomophthora muscae]